MKAAGTTALREDAAVAVLAKRAKEARSWSSSRGVEDAGDRRGADGKADGIYRALGCCGWRSPQSPVCLGRMACWLIEAGVGMCVHWLGLG